MAEYTYHYDNLTDRGEKVALAEGLGQIMLHDDFDADWVSGTEPHGTLIFADPTPPPPPTPGELFTQAVDKELNDNHTLALQAFKNWGTLSNLQKDQVLKFLLGYYLSSGQRLGYFSL